MKKRLLFCLMIITTMVFSTVSSVFVPVASAAGKSPAKDYEIYPIPHSIEYGKGMTSLRKGVQVIYDDTIDDVTKRKVEKVFTNNGLEAPTVVTEPSKDKINLLIGTKGSNGPVDKFAVKHVDSQGMDFDQIDAYQLEIKDNNITILGKDTDASFYGLVTLEAILAQSPQKVIRNLSIEDFANTEIRGFIEGYYGIPWSNEDRISLMKFGGNYKMNSYIFAPKDDPYHREKWDKLYPEEELAGIQKMAQVGNETKTRFVWTISPLGEVADLARREGEDAAMAVLDENTEKLLAKFEQLYDAGVRQFGVLGDDVGSLPLDYVVQLMNSVSEWAEEKGDVYDLVYCPASYNSGWAWNPEELNAYEEGFDEDIRIFWTGSTTCAPVVQSTIDVFKNKSNNGVERRDPLFWLNWPVNDVDMSRVFLGKGEMLQPGIENLAGVVTNPMQEAEASKIALFAIADYTWNTVDFNPQKSWDDSFKYIESDAAEELHELAKHMSDADPDGLELAESENIKELLNSITEKVNNGESLDEIAQEAIAEFQKIADAANGFLAKTKNDKLREELAPFVKALRDMVLANIEFMKTALAIEEGDKEEAWNTVSKASSLRKQSLNYDRPLLKGTMKAKPAQKRLQPFTDNLEKKVFQNIEKLLGVDVKQSKASMFTNVDDYKELSVTEEPAVTSIDTKAEVELDRNEYIGLKLSRIKDLSNIEATIKDGLSIQTSVNGIEWETVKDLNRPSDARYVRLINKTSDTIHFTLDTFKVASNEVKPKTVEGRNVKLYKSSPLNVLDGDLSTHTWFGEAQTKGQFITYNLGQKINLESLKVYVKEDEHDFPRHAVIESSLDGKEWHTAMTLGNQDGPNKGEESDKDRIEDIFNKIEGTYRTKEVKDIDQEARFLRFKVTRTKQGTGNWLRMQEIQINDGEFLPEFNGPTIEDKNVELHKSSLPLNVLDGDLSTYTWFAKRQTKGQFITYNLGQKINLDRLKVYVKEDEHDFPRHAVIESSLDGKEWHTAMTLGNQDGPNKGEESDEDRIEDIFNKLEDTYRTKEVKDIDQEARFLRFKVTRTKQGTGNWLGMQEIQINGDEFLREVNDPTITTTSVVNIGNSIGNIADGKLNTKFKPADGKAGEVLYHVGEAGTSVTSITLMEDPSNVSNSKVSVRTLNGWKELGTVDSGYTFFDTTNIDSILDLKIEWEDENAPALYEVKIDKVEDSGNVESTIMTMTSLVKQYAEDGKIENDRDVRLLQTHLISIDHFVKEGVLEKAVKHMNGFKQLVNNYQENGQMDKGAATTLIKHADNLIKKWQ
ncbi:hypothetical protein F3157_11170 [Virgibacillus dakarensis]|nr:hypothetical protein [Virgibacillus dakarensis]